MIPLTDEVNQSYEKQKVCYMCKKEFNIDENDKNEFNTDENNENEFSVDENDKNAFKPYYKARDHCHYTRKFRGAAHNICIYLKFTKKNAKGARIEEKSNQYAILLDLKIIN